MPVPLSLEGSLARAGRCPGLPRSVAGRGSQLRDSAGLAPDFPDVEPPDPPCLVVRSDLAEPARTRSSLAGHSAMTDIARLCCWGFGLLASASLPGMVSPLATAPAPQ